MNTNINIQQTPRRQNQYDVLRIMAMFGVVLAHCAISETDEFTQIMMTLAGTTVPIFFFLSGGFLLCRYDTLNNLKEYYKKRTTKILLPTIICEICYFIYTIIVDTTFYGLDFKTEIIEQLTNWKNYGTPGIGYHLWFMNVIIPFYIFAPLLILLRKKNTKIYCLLALIWLALSEINYYYGFISLRWYLAFLSYIPYMMIGDILKNIILPDCKMKRFPYLLVFTACIAIQSFFKISLINGNQIPALAEKILNESWSLRVVADPDPHQCINLLAALMAYCGFYYVKVERNFSALADMSFYIYLVHFAIAGICIEIIKALLGSFKLNISIDTWYIFIVRFIMTLAISVGISYIINRLQSYHSEKMVSNNG